MPKATGQKPGTESEGGITSSYASADGVKLKVPYSFNGSIYGEEENGKALESGDHAQASSRVNRA